MSYLNSNHQNYNFPPPQYGSNYSAPSQSNLLGGLMALGTLAGLFASAMAMNKTSAPQAPSAQQPPQPPAPRIHLEIDGQRYDITDKKGKEIVINGNTYVVSADGKSVTRKPQTVAADSTGTEPQTSRPQVQTSQSNLTEVQRQQQEINSIRQGLETQSGWTLPAGATLAEAREARTIINELRNTYNVEVAPNATIAELRASLDAKRAETPSTDEEIVDDQPYIQEDEPEQVVTDPRAANRVLQDPNTMSREKILEELGPENQHQYQNQSTDDLRRELVQKRNDIALDDEGSNVIDQYVGTFKQGTLGNCSLLATIDNLPEDWIENNVRKDGDAYFVNIAGQEVRVTEEELNGSITIDGRTYSNTEIVEGDKDATLIAMAFMRRYENDVDSPDVAGNTNRWFDMSNPDGVTGLEVAEVRALFFGEQTQQIGASGQRAITEDDLRNAPRGTTMELSLQGRELPEGVSTARVNGNNGIRFDNSNTQIVDFHNYSIRGYDEDSREVVLANPHNTAQEIRIPLEYMNLFKMTVSAEDLPAQQTG